MIISNVTSVIIIIWLGTGASVGIAIALRGILDQFTAGETDFPP